ncbi:MAG: nucleotidyltransferase family protein [Verrucomicrobia bacterium]|nr:nucleotidyltransferase family protein [Verrucomicrobiota bacterium]
MTGAIILAAGGSSRLGQPKQLLPFRGKILVRTVIDAAREAGCSPVVVVTGSNHEQIHPELVDANVIEVRNTNWQRGIGSSIRSGVQASIDRAPDMEAILLLVCDQPAVNARLIERLIATHETTRKEIVACSYADTLGVPALFGCSFFKELLSLGDEAGAKSIILQNPERVAQLAFPEGAIDIDNQEDWEKLNRPNRSGQSETFREN